MRVLGLDTATASTAVAIVDGERVLARGCIDDRRHSVNLLPVMQEVLERAGVARDELSAVAVGLGPGSFTGIRIGLTVAKTLAYVLGKPLVGVSSLKALALGALEQAEVLKQLRVGQCQICCAADALKSEVYSARFRVASDGRLQQLESEGARDPSDWALSLRDDALSEPLVFVGSGALRYSVLLAQTLGEQAIVPKDPKSHDLDAAAVATLGLQRILRVR